MSETQDVQVGWTPGSSINPDELERTELEFPDGNQGRIYYNPDDHSQFWLSVTTITGRLEDPDKKYALRRWREINDGSDGNAWHKYLLQYSQVRGTLIHWWLQHHLPADGPGVTHEERNAIDWVQKYNTQYDRVHSVLHRRLQKRSSLSATGYELGEEFPDRDTYVSAVRSPSQTPQWTLKRIVTEDMAWALQAFASATDRLGLLIDPTVDDAEGLVQSYLNAPFVHNDKTPVWWFFRDQISNTNIRSMERYIPTDYGYSGQYDLLYDKPDGTTCLLDFKTSSQMSYGYKLQLAAYAEAIDVAVDELIVCRLNPDGLDVEVSCLSEWNETYDGLVAEFMELKRETERLVDDLDWDAGD